LDGVRPARGRPRKFASPSRAVTLTLPEQTIAALESVDRDLSRAVVRIVPPELAAHSHAAAQLVPFGRHAVIAVNPTRSLERRTGVMLIPLSDGRALIALDESITTARLELLIQDALDERDLSAADAEIFRSIGDLLKDARRSPSVSLQQKSIVVIEHGSRAGKRPRQRRTRTTRI
jgi:hypothetical protein